MPYLFRFEIKGIQSFIFSSNRLVEIAGGSAIVDTIFTTEPDSLEEWGVTAAQVKQCAAGSATLMFDDKASLSQFVSSFEMKVHQKAPGIDLTYDWVPVGDVDEDLQYRRLMRQLQYGRNEKTIQLPELGPLVLRSGRTGGGVVKSERVNQSNQQMDRASYDKAMVGRNSRGPLELRLLDEQWTEEYTFTKGNCFEKGDSMVAIIHLDGNDIGSRIMNMGLNKYEAFSKALTKVTLESTKHAINAVIEQIRAEVQKKERKLFKFEDTSQIELPIRPIIVGGDDCTIVVEVQHAMLFVQAYVDKFRELTRQPQYQSPLRGPMEASAGVALVKAKAPFSGNYGLAEALCSYSKNVLRQRCSDGERKAYTPSAVTFHRVTTTAIPDWSTIQALEYHTLVHNPMYAHNAESTVAKNKGSRLSAGPYLIGEHQNVDGFYQLSDLRQMVEAMSKLPRGSFREWMRVVQTDPVRAKQRWERIDEVLRGGTKKQRAAWNNLQDVMQSDDSMASFRVRAEGGDADEFGFVSAIGDALTLKKLQVSWLREGQSEEGQ